MEKKEEVIEDNLVNEEMVGENIAEEAATAKMEFNGSDVMSVQRDADNESQITGDALEAHQGPDHDTEEDDVIIVKQGKYVDQKANNRTPGKAFAFVTQLRVGFG